jgi:hypothetical protein
MAFDAGAIVAKLKLDNKQYKGELQKSKGLTSKFASAATMAMRGLAVGGFAFATKKLIEFTSEGARLVDMRMAFDRMAASSGTSRKQLVGDVRAITKALTNQQIMQAANTLELLGVGMENTARMAEIARAAGVALGRDTAYMLESISTGTARQSRLWLDNLGIIISIEEANRDYAASLGKTASALTDTEKRAAFLNAVLTKGTDIIDKVGASSESASEKTAHWGTAWGNFFDEMKAGIGSSDVAGWLDGIAGAIDNVTEAMKRNRTAGVAGGPNVFPANPWLQMFPAAETATPFGFTANSQREFEALINRARSQSTPDAGGAIRERTSFSTIDWGGIPVPELTTGMEGVNEQFSTAQNLAASFFSTIATGAVVGAGAMKDTFGRAIGMVSTALGTMIMQGAAGFAAFASANPFAAIAAGAALIALGGQVAGMFSSGMSGGSVSVPRAPTTSPVTVEGRAGVTIHVEGDFLGEKYWVQQLMRRIDSVRRQGGDVEVFK